MRVRLRAAYRHRGGVSGRGVRLAELGSDAEPEPEPEPPKQPRRRRRQPDAQQAFLNPDIRVQGNQDSI